MRNRMSGGVRGRRRKLPPTRSDTDPEKEEEYSLEECKKEWKIDCNCN